MRTQTSRTFFDYWTGLHDGDAVPARSDIDPAAIAAILSNVFLLDMNGISAATFRMAGSSVCQSFGMEITGRRFDSIFRHAARRAARRLLARASSGSAIVLQCNATSRSDRECAVEMLLVPLLAETGGARLAGSLATVERPYWIGFDPLRTLELRSVRVLRSGSGTTAGRAVSEPVPLWNAFDEEPQQTSSRFGKQFGHLFVLPGGLEG